MTPAKRCDAQISTIIRTAQELGDADDLEDAIIGISEFLAAAQSAADSCKALYSKDMFV